VTSLRRDATVGRLGRAVAAVESSSDGFLAARMLGWALVLPVLKSVLPLERLVRIMATDGRPGARDLRTERTIGTLARLTHRIVGVGRRDNCLERSLIAYRYLSATNADPRLVVGACRGETGIEGHVWLLVDGAPVHDTWEGIGRFAPVTAFRADGSTDAVGTVPVQ
jgi:hypothetical protein